VLFSRNVKLLLEDPLDEIDDWRIAQTKDSDGNEVDVGFSERYIWE
jgi:hypothetical protein